jgi:hypothetical protein
MARKPIYDTPEYKLASRDMQGWAFTHKNNYTTAVDAAKEMGVKVDGRTVKVKANTGEMVEVPVDMNYYRIQPTKNIRVATWTDDKGKKTHVYLLKGSSPKIKSAVYVTSTDFQNSDDFKALKKEIEDGAQAYYDKHHEMLKAELSKSHPQMAKKAAKELPALADGDDAAQKIYAWFQKNKFEMRGIKPEDFKAFAAEVKKTGHIRASFEISARPDGYGHQTGTSGEIDFAGKKISLYGWSSDD